MESNPPHHRRPGRALLLSLLLPGLGQLYCGQLVRALAFACASLIAGVLLAWLLLTTGSFFSAMTITVILGLAVSLVAGIDAFLQARNSRDYQLSSLNRPIIYALFAILAGGADLGGAMGMSLLVRDRFMEAFVIPTEAMAPTIQPGDRVLARKGVYLDEDPKRGDLVIFKAPGDRRKNWIKRVVALPGETIAIRGGKLWINGVAEDFEDYEVSGMEQVADFEEISVPDHHCFVLGDNRAISKDSRSFGPLGFGSITARVESCFWPMDRAGSLKLGEGR